MKKTSLVIVFGLAVLGAIAQRNIVKVKLHSIVGYSHYEDFAQRAADAFEKVLNSDEFKGKVLSAKFIKTKGFNNQQLYETIIRAHETQGEGGTDGVVDLRVRTLNTNTTEIGWKDNCQKSTIGIDGNGDGVTAICPNKLAFWANDDSIDELAGHYAHEYMHILGFDHYKFLSTQSWREKTFVYMIGDIVSDIISKQ